MAQAELFANTGKIYQQFKNRKTLYGNLPPKNIEKLKPWDMVNVYLIVPYRKPIRQQQPGGTVICKNSSLTSIAMIDPATDWF